MEVIVGIPIKPFASAKQRLGAVLDAGDRARIARTLAERTVGVVERTRAVPLVLSADSEVTEWARSVGVGVIEDEGSSYIEAASAAVTHVRGLGAAWAILPADLPTVTSDDILHAIDVLDAGGSVLAPSSDGGTSLIGGPLDDFPFAFGPASFHRHLSLLARHDPTVIVRPGLLLDLDDPSDLAAAAATDLGSWLRR